MKEKLRATDCGAPMEANIIRNNDSRIKGSNELDGGHLHIPRSV